MSLILKIIHYCSGFSESFGGKPWSLHHHVCLASAITRIRLDAVLFTTSSSRQVPGGKYARLGHASPDTGAANCF
jgi:hypothetical protein